jgi:hypothetical protein
MPTLTSELQATDPVEAVAVEAEEDTPVEVEALQEVTLKDSLASEVSPGFQ